MSTGLASVLSPFFSVSVVSLVRSHAQVSHKRYSCPCWLRVEREMEFDGVSVLCLSVLVGGGGDV